MFTSLVRQAASETGLKQYQAKLTFALKAQAQCRSALEALAEIKNPRPVSFVKQANIANGPQQVNNGAAAGADPMQKPLGHYICQPQRCYRVGPGQIGEVAFFLNML
jgi:hypothetical protein